MTGTYKKWVCWHPSLGFLTFGSYRQATVHKEPNPRGCFSKKRDAEKRTGEAFYFKNTPYPGYSIQVLEVTFTWHVPTPATE